MKIELNGKALLAVGLLSAGLAFGEYVSVINSNEVSYLTAEPKQEITTIGSVIFRMDDVNPADIYGGTWELITGDAALTFGNGSVQTGVATGDNSPIVPLPQHSHTMNHDHPSATTNTDTHDHNINLRRSGYTAAAAPSWHTDTNTVYPGITLTSGGNYYADSRGPIDSDSHSHTVNLPNYTGNTGNAGQSNATLDVRGARIAINVWKRVN